MKKKLNILGRKVPILAVMMALLVIGTASAALILNYATLTGTFTVGETLSVTGNDVAIPNGEAGAITFDVTSGEAIFTIDNDGADTSVNLVTTLFLDANELPISDARGITITYGVDTSISQSYELTGTADAGILSQDILVDSGLNTVTVDFDQDPALVTGVYTIQVAVNPV